MLVESLPLCYSIPLQIKAMSWQRPLPPANERAMGGNGPSYHLTQAIGKPIFRLLFTDSRISQNVLLFLWVPFHSTATWSPFWRTLGTSVPSL